MNKGFSIIELLVISAIIATFSVVLILNFRPSSTNEIARVQTASVVLSDIRRAQSLALAGSRHLGSLVCGFGFHYVSPNSYLIYAKAVPVSGACSSVTTRNYQSDDLDVETKILINTSLEFRSSFYDIFFEPPDPKTYINNVSTLTVPHVTITFQLKGQQNCGQDTCTEIKVYTSGQIDLN